MGRFVVDASVVVKWFITEEHTDAAIRLKVADHVLSCPELLLIEVANTAWKKVRRGEIPYEMGQDIVRSVRALPLEVEPLEESLAPAWEVAVHFGRSVYDGLYIALAIALEAPVVTADRRLCDAMRGSSLENYVRWIEDVGDNI